MNDKDEGVMSISEKPLITVIAICHNHAPYIIETLESIRNQTYGNIELIIINNLKDDCEEIIEKWMKNYDVQCQFIQNESPLNISKNFNLGLSFANGKYFQGISCDDVLIVNKYECQVKLFETLGERYAVLHSNVQNINSNGILIKNSLRSTWIKNKFNIDLKDFDDISKILGWGVMVSAPSALIRTSIVRELGGYNNYIWEDYPMWVKLATSGYLFRYLDDPLVNIRIVSNSISRTKYDKKSRYEIDKMLLDIFYDHYKYMNLGFWTRLRFSPKYNSLLAYDKKIWFAYILKFIKTFGIFKGFLSILNIFIIYPLFVKLGFFGLYNKIQTRFGSWITKYI